ncbi:hypothetical protein GCM10010405_14430 [Streptomyces macrosporus]|uniref:Uncharacterized protein n=1 Tax=Streptomyces macrosporus TaxID=44032 RepID=A0ABN3JJW5_9ACTN
MRTSMAMGVLLWERRRSGKCAGRAGVRGYGRWGPRGVARSVAGAVTAPTSGTGEAAQVHVEARHEQRARGAAREVVAHIVVNHGLIVTIPGPGSGWACHDADRAVSPVVPSGLPAGCQSW